LLVPFFYILLVDTDSIYPEETMLDLGMFAYLTEKLPNIVADEEGLVINCYGPPGTITSPAV
jgi:hypothetical protein